MRRFPTASWKGWQESSLALARQQDAVTPTPGEMWNKSNSPPPADKQIRSVQMPLWRGEGPGKEGFCNSSAPFNLAPFRSDPCNWWGRNIQIFGIEMRL